MLTLLASFAQEESRSTSEMLNGQFARGLSKVKQTLSAFTATVGMVNSSTSFQRKLKL